MLFCGIILYFKFALSAAAVEYTDCFSADE